MSKLISGFILFVLFLLFGNLSHVFAADNPLTVPNNKIGIHVLNASEISDAAKLVNSNGGDWGYVLIPIQSGDKDLAKWQHFMNECKKNRVIPLVRLATEGDYFNTSVWREPSPIDIIDFANFLNSLEWPTKNRYVIVFNEVNRGDEWGGAANPTEYAELLSFAVSVFKSKSTDFYMITAGLDNAAPEQGTLYMNQFNYLRRMNDAVPGIFNQVDALSSHSYPNPGFSQPPNVTNSMGVASFAYERALIKTMSSKNLPVFITETGWSSKEVAEDVRARYYDETFRTIWNDSGIVAITPFLLQAGTGPFEQFTFINAAGQPTGQYKVLQNMAKVRGVPHTPTKRVLGAKDEAPVDSKDFSSYEKAKRSFSVVNVMQNVFEFLIK